MYLLISSRKPAAAEVITVLLYLPPFFWRAIASLMMLSKTISNALAETIQRRIRFQEPNESTTAFSFLFGHAKKKIPSFHNIIGL